MKERLLLLALGMTLPGCHGRAASPPPATEPAMPAAGDTPARETANSAVRQDIIAELEAYYADLSGRDWNAFATHFWSGATLTTVWQPPDEEAPHVVITSLDEFIEQAPSGPGSREIFEERMLGAEVRVQGDLAHVWARYTARFGDPGDVAEWEGIDAFTLMRHDGRWRIVALAYTVLQGDG